MRTEKLYLTDIVESADAVARFIGEHSQEEFLKDELRQSAVLQKLIVIGEAAAKLPNEFKAQHSDIPWPAIVGFRNIAVHAYFWVDWTIVWATITQDVPLLRGRIAEILAKGFTQNE